MQHLELSSGDRMPALGLGTWKSQPGEVGQAVVSALEAGYRHIDCARIYGNEAEIGEALSTAFESGIVTRSELWITSKLWNDAHAPRDVRPALEQTLADLRLDYLDLYLMHWPVAHRLGVLGPGGPGDYISLDELPLAVTWAALEEAAGAGLARHIGVSNFSSRKLRELVEGASRAPEMNQVELHPYLQQEELLETARELGVHVTAYSPLGSPDRPDSMKQSGRPALLEDETIRDIAARLSVSPAEILIRWAIERGTAVIPKSVDAGRIRQNLAAAELELGADDMDAIARLESGLRYVDGTFWECEGGPYTAASLWDE